MASYAPVNLIIQPAAHVHLAVSLLRGWVILTLHGWGGAFELEVKSYKCHTRVLNKWRSLMVKGLLLWVNGLEIQFSHYRMMLTIKYPTEGFISLFWNFWSVKVQSMIMIFFICFQKNLSHWRSRNKTKVELFSYQNCEKEECSCCITIRKGTQSYLEQ